MRALRTTYALLQGALRALFANNDALSKAIQRARSLRERGIINAAKAADEAVAVLVRKDRRLTTKARKALQAHHSAIARAV